MFGSLIAALLAIPVLAIVAIVMAVGTRERIKRLEFRLARLEAWLAERAGDLPSSAPEALPTPATEPAQIPVEEAPSPPEPEIPPPAAAPVVPIAAKPTISLEERFGTQWVVWAGGIALALGGFFLVRQAIEQGWFGPVVQVCSAPLLPSL